MDSISLEVYVGPADVHMRLNRRHIYGPHVIHGVDTVYKWCASRARVEKLLQKADGPTIPFAIRQGNRGIDAILCDKTLAGNKKNKHAVLLHQCSIPMDAIVHALEGEPHLTLDVGAAYATISGQKVVIFKRTQDATYKGVFVEHHETAVWHATGICHSGDPEQGLDLAARWEDAPEDTRPPLATSSSE